jgi:hypothetical protein
MSTKLREGEEREMLLKLTRSTLGALNFSLRVSAKLRRERGKRECFFFNFGSQDFQEWGIKE